MGVTPAGVSVREFKSRWGSCDKRGKVTFNWRIIKAPHSIVDYVVLHELCHLVHPNHSKEFWMLVARYDARYVEHRAWLNERGEMLL
jgi:predicted metal-dependent hydrolase